VSAYFRPHSLSEAVALLAAHPGLKVLAGGTDLYPAAADRAPHMPVLDLAGIAALRGIERQGDGLRIGALATWTDVQRTGLGPAHAALVQAGREVGSPQIQNVATVVGNICNASPAADGTVALLALDAQVLIAGPAGSRRVPLADFVTGVRRVALAPGEVVSGLYLPPAAGRSAFLKLGARKYLVISVVMVAARLVLGPDGRVAQAALAVGACAPVARRLPRLEAALIGLDPAAIPGAVRPELVEGLAPIRDVRADAAYRHDAVPVLLRRALAACLEG
jgi:CO/xanthine dehydrogenase FAD-binding subunit